MPRSYYLHTLGCKLNQADTGRVAAALQARGMVAAARPGDADLLVVNTCTVTARADADGRQALRRLSRLNPRAQVVAMGCYAKRQPEALQQLQEVHVVSPGADPAPVVAAAERAFPAELIRVAERYHAVPTATGRTRAYLKIQDGCDLSCSYCIIPAVRGRSRSLPPDSLVTALQRLVAAGFVEVVLTGVNTGDYGKDLPGDLDLLGLLRRLTAVEGLGRLRLNSLEPRTVQAGLVDFLATTDKVAPHLQIPLQSGSDRILARMRRNYRSGFYMELVGQLHHRIPDIGLGADVIVGFPGETDDDFARTETLVRDTPLSYLHVFSYSRRPGTDAAALPDSVPTAVIKERATRLRRLAAAKARAFRSRFKNRTLTAVTLSDPARDGSLRALTGNFFEVLLPAASRGGNQLLDVRITETDEDTAHGVVVVTAA